LEDKVEGVRGVWQSLVGEALPPESAAAFARETAETNRRRIKVLGPLMAVVHLLHIAFFWVPPSARASLAPEVVRWRSGIVVAHLVMVPFVLMLAALAYRGGRRIAPLLGPLIATGYLVHGAVCTGLDQLVVTNVTAYVGYCIGMAVVVSLSPLAALWVYACGVATVFVAMFHFQESASALRSSLPTCCTASVIGLVFSQILQAARRRDFVQRLTIDRQRKELEQLNSSLEKRVEEAVAQLQGQVRQRSSELTRALSRLAQHRQIELSVRGGLTLGGRFRVEEQLGEGGMGEVWRGVDTESGAKVAIKVIQASSSQQLDAIKRFIREAGAAATVTHPAVVRMLHVDVTDDGLLYQVQELVDGATLKERMKGPWSPAHAARLGAVLSDALAAAHAEGVVHRDVKPDNVMLTDELPGLKLLDFGIAKLHDAVSALSENTNVGVILGTPAYMAPEQVDASAPATDRADVYAAGIILYRLICGRLPFDAATAQEMMRRHARDAAPDVRKLKPATPEKLALLIARCLLKDPTARPTAATLTAELRAIADELGAPSLEQVPEPVSDPTVATPKRRISPVH
jgi:serine/threonine-protein kinase